MVFTVPKPFLIQPPVQGKLIYAIFSSQKKVLQFLFSCIKYLSLVETTGPYLKLLRREQKCITGSQEDYIIFINTEQHENKHAFLKQLRFMWLSFMWKNVKMILSFFCPSLENLGS